MPGAATAGGTVMSDTGAITGPGGAGTVTMPRSHGASSASHDEPGPGSDAPGSGRGRLTWTRTARAGFRCSVAGMSLVTVFTDSESLEGQQHPPFQVTGESWTAGFRVEPPSHSRRCRARGPPVT